MHTSPLQHPQRLFQTFSFQRLGSFLLRNTSPFHSVNDMWCASIWPSTDGKPLGRLSESHFLDLQCRCIYFWSLYLYAYIFEASSACAKYDTGLDVTNVPGNTVWTRWKHCCIDSGTVPSLSNSNMLAHASGPRYSYKSPG